MPPSAPNLPAAALWTLRGLAILGLATLLLGPGHWQSYGMGTLLGASGVAALSVTTSHWFGRVLTAVTGFGMLGAAGVMFFVKCVPVQ